MVLDQGLRPIGYISPNMLEVQLIHTKLCWGVTASPSGDMFRTSLAGTMADTSSKSMTSLVTPMAEFESRLTECLGSSRHMPSRSSNQGNLVQISSIDMIDQHSVNCR